ncbi:MAG TPA: hypothetical protein VF475_13705 [Sphingobium sp.]
MIAVDLIAAAHREYERRRRAWIAMRDRAANSIERARIVTQANADLLIWQDVVIFAEYGSAPLEESRTMTLSVRRTLDRMRESEKATNEQIHDLHFLHRATYFHACYRHGWDWDRPAERQAA